MQNDEFMQKVLAALNQKSHQMPKHTVMANVMATLHAKKQQRVNRMSIGLAFAAAIAGITALPSVLEHRNDGQTETQIAKLSPQMAEDLDMLMVLGENTRGG